MTDKQKREFPKGPFGVRRPGEHSPWQISDEEYGEWVPLVTVCAMLNAKPEPVEGLQEAIETASKKIVHIVSVRSEKLTCVDFQFTRTVISNKC